MQADATTRSDDLARVEAIRSGDLALVEAVEGWLARAEAALLMELAAAVRAEHRIVEVGNYRGRSTVALALGARSGAGAQVYSIDPHVEFTGARGGKFGRADQAALYANLARAGVGEQVNVVGLASCAVAASWEARDVGLLFLDGDHRYEAVRADFEAWEPHLVEGAAVVFDDIDFPDVVRLVDELTRAGRIEVRAGVGKVLHCVATGACAPRSAERQRRA